MFPDVFPTLDEFSTRGWTHLVLSMHNGTHFSGGHEALTKELPQSAKTHLKNRRVLAVRYKCLVGRLCWIAGTADCTADTAVLSSGSASQPGDQAAANTVLKAKSLSLTGLARVLPFWSTMVMASPDVSDRGPLVV